MTEIQNSKQLAFYLIRDLEFIWPNFKIRCACNLLFPVYMSSAFVVPISALTAAPQKPLFHSVVSDKA